MPHRGAVGYCNITQELQGSLQQLVFQGQKCILWHCLPAALLCVGPYSKNQKVGTPSLLLLIHQRV